VLGGARRFGAHEEGEGRGHIIVATRLELVVNNNFNGTSI